MARIYATRYSLKLAIRSEEPVQWKGGRTIALYKGKGAHDICANFRSILLMSTMGKALRAAMRPLINAPYVHTSPQGQLGGATAKCALWSPNCQTFHCVAQTEVTVVCCPVL